jgi:hypothetical protein
MRNLIIGLGLGGAIILLSGCQSAPKTSVGRDGVTYTNTIHNFRVWVADQYNPAELKGKTLSVAPTASEVAEQKKKDEIEQFERLRRLLPDQISYALDSKKVFAKVNQPAVTEGTDLKLNTMIVEYYPGNAALRFTVGFSAGYPSITVHGTITDAAGKPLVRFETQREFEARPFEYGDEQILSNNIKDLAVDLADFIDRIANGKPLKR